MPSPGCFSYTEAAQENPPWAPWEGGSSADTADKNRVFQGKFLLILKKMPRGDQQKHDHTHKWGSSHRLMLQAMCPPGIWGRTGGFASLSPVHVTKTQKKRGGTQGHWTQHKEWGHISLAETHSLFPCTPQAVHFHQKPRQGYLGAHISLAFVCLPSRICKHHCRRADLCHIQNARISASCLKESWDFDKTDGRAPLALEKVSYAPRASGRGNLLRPVVAPTRTKKSCSSYCHLSLSNSTANNMSLCWGGGEQSEGEKKGRLKYPKNSLQRFLKRREPVHAHTRAHTVPLANRHSLENCSFHVFTRL